VIDTAITNKKPFCADPNITAACPPPVLYKKWNWAAKPDDHSTWNLAECRAAAPISQWSTAGLVGIITNALLVGAWGAGLGTGFKGDTLHMVWLRAFQASAVVGLLNLVFSFLAWNAAGTLAQVWTSY